MIFDTQIVAQTAVAKGTHEVTFKRPKGFQFKAGQYIQIAVSELMQPDPKGRSRQFSIVSSPHDMEYLRIIFRTSGSGFKETLMSLPKDTQIRVEQAAGSFILPTEPTRSHVFVAGGVGIAPFMSFFNQNAQDVWDNSITLFFGNQNPESAAYLQELKLIASQQRNFSLNELYKKPTPDVFVKLAKKYMSTAWWVVGPPAMVANTVHGLQSGGVSSQNILTESFEGY